MFTKNRMLLAVRFFIILVMLNGTYGVFPIKEHVSVYALGETPGSLDATFDGDGLVTTDISIYGDQGWDVVIQPNGKIVVGGYTHSGGSTNFDFVLCRYNSDGSLDVSFDTDGKVTTDFSNQQDYGRAIALQVDGKIIIAGYSEFNDGSTTESEFALARYNSDGSLDTSFDLDGKVTTNLGDTYEFLSAIAIQTDGKIIVVGSKNIGINNDDIVVVRYNTNGTLDTTFGTDGIVGTAIGSGYETALSVTVQPDGKILVGGVSYNGSNMDLALLRYNSDGALDTGFGTDGIVTKDFGIGFSDERGGHIALQSDGKILVAADAVLADTFLLARYNDDGSPDITFGTDGFVTTFISGSSYDQVQDIALQQNGKIILAGHTGSDFVLARYNSDGSLDATFDSDGKVITDFGTNQDDLGNAVFIQPDGRIVVAGYRYISGSNYDVAVARYIGGEVSQIYYVKQNANGANNGSSWTDAYTDLQSALSAASAGDEIWVAAGTYKPGTLRTESFQLKNGVAVYGGFAGTEIQRDQRDFETNVTILSGEIGGAGASDNSYHVVVGNGTDGTALLDGLTVTAGNANSAYPNDSGGGVFNNNGDPSLSNIIVSGNSAGAWGGGIYANDSSSILTNMVFSENSSKFGGGIFIRRGNPSLTNATFSENSATDGGGGMSIIDSHLSLYNMTFNGNTTAYGGGILITTSNPTLMNVTLSGNSANSEGGGIYIDRSSPIIRNSIFYGNVGGEIIKFDSIPSVSYSIVQGGYAGTGNLNSNPLFGPLADNGGFTQTMALSAGSPAIDAGDDVNCPSTDQRGVARPQGSHCDIGAYEYVPPLPTPTLPPGVVSHARDLSTPFVPPSGSATGLLPIRTKPPQQAQSAVVPTSTPMPEPVLPTSTPQPVFAEVVNPTSTPEPVIAMDAADTTAPETTLIVTPGSTSRQRSAFFAYESTEAGTFVCSLDGSAYFACERSIRFTGLGEGMHLFQVRAVDEAGNYDDTPVVYTWLIERNVDIQRYKATRK